MTGDAARRIVWIWVLVALCCVNCDRDGCCDSGDNNPPVGGLRVDFGAKWCPADTGRIGYTHNAKTWDELLEFGQRSVWIADLTTGETMHVTAGTLLDWMPDGNRILVGRDGEPAILKDLLTGAEDTLLIYSGPVDLSPTGGEAAYIQWEQPTGLYIMDLATRETRWIASEFYCDWSPDGEMILCEHLTIIGRDGTVLQRISLGPGPRISSHARWSPDGTRIAFGGYCNEDSQDPAVWVLNTDGTGLHMIVCPGALPSWSPSARYVAYSATSSEASVSAIWVCDADGDARRQVTFP